MRINSKAYWALWRNVAQRKRQDIERGIESPRTWLYPPVRCQIFEDEHTGKITFQHIFTPDENGTAAELELFYANQKEHLDFHRGRRTLQKRVRNNHNRDKQLVNGKTVKRTAYSPVDGSKEITLQTPMDRLIDKELQYIEADDSFQTIDKRARKKYIQAKYRYLKPHKST